MPSKDLFPTLSKHWEELVPNKDAEENGDDEDDEADPGTFQVLLLHVITKYK